MGQAPDGRPLRAYGEPTFPLSTTPARSALIVSSAVLLLLCLGLTAAAASGGQAKPTLTIASFNMCGSVNPVVSGSITSDHQLAYEPLIRWKPGGSFRPGLATSWSVKPGNKVMTLTLRRNARFSDGAPVTAQAVKTWLDYRATKSSFNDANMPPIRSVEALSKWVVRLTLKSPNPIFAKALSDYGSDWGNVTSPRAIALAKADPSSNILDRQTFGAGQYVLDRSSTVTNDHCTYVPNKHYYDKSAIKWGKVITKRITDPNAALAALRAGQVDVLQFGSPNTVQAATQAGLKVLKYYDGSAGIWFMDHGTLVPALGDVRVRQALNYAVDRKKIARALIGDVAAATSVPNPRSDGSDPKYSNYYTYNPAKARSLLAAAGYPNGFTFNVTVPGPWAGTLNQGPLHQAIAQDLAAVGVKVDLNVTASYDEWWNKDTLGHRFAGDGFSTATNPTWLWYASNLKPGAPLGDQHGWHDPVSDRLWLQAQRAGPKKAADLWRQLLNRATTQAYFLPVLMQPQHMFVSKRVQGVTPGVYSSNPVNWFPARSS
jgi:peptide/nickel transport system substrate-binding protein